MNRPPRYILCKDDQAYREYLGPMDKQTFQQYKWIRATEIRILNHPVEYSKHEYKGFILPCFKDNPDYKNIWGAHISILGDFVPEDEGEDDEVEPEDYTDEYDYQDNMMGPMSAP